MTPQQIQELKEQAQELIDLGDSREKAEGYGMMRIIEALDIKKFNIKKQGNNYVAFDTVDKTISYGRINIKTGKCVGGTLCFTALREHLASKQVVAKVSYQLWITIEKHTEYVDGTEKYEDLKDEETRSVGRFSTLEEAYEQMSDVADNNSGDFTEE